MGDIEINICAVCNHEGQVLRHYQDFKTDCACCNGSCHTEYTYHCITCKPLKLRLPRQFSPLQELSRPQRIVAFPNQLQIFESDKWKMQLSCTLDDHESDQYFSFEQFPDILIRTHSELLETSIRSHKYMYEFSRVSGSESALIFGSNIITEDTRILLVAHKEDAQIEYWNTSTVFWVIMALFTLSYFVSQFVTHLNQQG